MEWQWPRLDSQEGFQRVVSPSIFNLRRGDIDTHSSGLSGQKPYQCSRTAAEIEMFGRPSKFPAEYVQTCDDAIYSGPHLLKLTPSRSIQPVLIRKSNSWLRTQEKVDIFLNGGCSFLIFRAFEMQESIRPEGCIEQLRA
jgi:hypothetical protein